MRNLLMCAMMTMGAGAAIAQPVQWRVQDGGNGHWYEWRTCTTGLDAERIAMALHAPLVSIASAAENEFVRIMLVNSGREFAMIGYIQSDFQSAPDVGWNWTSGEPTTFTNWWDFDGGYSFVAPEDRPCAGPTIQEDNQCNQGLMYLNGKWDDIERGPSCAGFAGSSIAIIEWSADCNGDGIVDKGQILSGELPDANNNGIPDWSVTVVRQPTNQAVGVDQPVYFSVEVSTSPGCTTPVSYRWERRNPQVLDANAPNAWVDLSDGGGFLNTGTASLTILRPTAGLATGYRCKISGGCGCEGNGTGVLYTNVVNFAPACPSDFNNDGSVDGDDVITFFERWDGGC